MTYASHLIIYFSVYSMVALSLNLFIGHCGRFTLAHGAYFSVGAYTYALATIVFHFGTLVSLALTILAGSALSLGLSVPGHQQQTTRGTGLCRQSSDLPPSGRLRCG